MQVYLFLTRARCRAFAEIQAKLNSITDGRDAAAAQVKDFLAKERQRNPTSEERKGC